MKIKVPIIKGYQVASGLSKNSPYEKGTIELQKPFFKKLGLDLDDYYNGTLNLNISPYKFVCVKSNLIFKNIKWHNDFSAETFSFSKCKIFFNNSSFNALVYYPHKETKIRHTHKDTTIEIISTFINNLNYGDFLEVELNIKEVLLIQ